MFAQAAADPRFLLLHARLSAARAHARLSRVVQDSLAGIIIQHDGEPLTYTLATAAELAGWLQDAPPEAALSAFVAGFRPAEILTPYADARDVERAVVMQDGHPAGVILQDRALEGAADEAQLFEEHAEAAAPDFPPADFTISAPPSAEIDLESFVPRDPPTPAAKPAPAQPPSDSRALVATGPAEIALDEVTSLLVSLTAVGESPAGSLPISIATGGTLDVLVRPVQGFSVEGTDMATITVAGPGSTLPVLFKLRATTLGAGALQIYAFREGQPLGYMTYTAEITESVDKKTDTSPTMPLPRREPEAPDLSLFILERPVGNETEITLRLSAVDPDLGLNLKPFGPVRLRTSPPGYFQEFFRDVERLPLKTEEDARKAERRMARKGAQLFQTLFPEDLQTLFWSLRDRIQEIQIQSEEPWIPWELCKLVGREDGRIVEGPFLCEAFAMTRWMPGIGQQPILSAKRIGLIAPRDSGLAYAQHEFDYITGLAGAERQVDDIPATYLDVTDALTEGVYDVLHFTGHGVFRAPDPNHSGMELQDGDQLVPEDISGLVQNLGNARPLVFLNACQLGRSDLSLTDVGGWAPQFLRAGAAAFIGAYWSVYDDSALAFARTIYDELLRGATIAQAVQTARLAARAGGDPSWLAYTVFAHPAARIEV